MGTDVEFGVTRIASVNPATGEVLGELDSAGPAEVRAAVARAHATQPEWNAWGISNRVGVVRRFQQILLARKTDIARRITQEAGKPQVEALLTEVLVVLDAARFLADNAFALLREEKLAHGNAALKAKSGRILHEPYGVVGIISPWNYPFSIPATEALAALVAGNAVVLKRGFDNFASEVPRLAHAKPPNGIPRKADVHGTKRRFQPQLPIHPTLNDAKQSLSLSIPMLFRIVILSEAKDLLSLTADS